MVHRMQHQNRTPRRVREGRHLEHAMEEMGFSARAHDRILKVARTIADLSGALDIRANDVLEAIHSGLWIGSYSINETLEISQT